MYFPWDYIEKGEYKSWQVSIYYHSGAIIGDANCLYSNGDKSIRVKLKSTDYEVHPFTSSNWEPKPNNPHDPHNCRGDKNKCALVIKNGG